MTSSTDTQFSSTEIAWTQEELDEFNDLTWKMCSANQMDRISARLDMPKFIEKHGKPKCDAMYAYLTENDVGPSDDDETHMWVDY